MMFVRMTPEEREIEIAKLDYEFAKQEFSDRLRIQETLGTAGLRSLVLVNGGALIALFTFIGNTGAAETITDVGSVWRGFACFVGGVVAAVAAHVTAYFMQASFGYQTTFEMWNAQAKALGGDAKYDPLSAYRAAYAYMVLTVVLVIASLVLFCLGAGLSLAGVTGR